VANRDSERLFENLAHLGARQRPDDPADRSPPCRRTVTGRVVVVGADDQLGAAAAFADPDPLVVEPLEAPGPGLAHPSLLR
jgi:hypothetical protein